ncbi:MAG: hypothetical protein Q4G26_03125 [Paracoccus sp. (in: a-proteobacteria)]|nr:hypothetical protein [Paracoccus sp. (in: a-proteobacteria)]
MFYFDATALIIGMMLAMAMLAMLVIAHLTWLITLWETRLSLPFPTMRGRLALLAAALTPLIGFYALHLSDRITGRAPAGPPVQWWRWLLPVASLGVLALASLRIELRYVSEYRSVDSFLKTLRMLGLYWLLFTAIVHMAGMVFNATRRGPLTSRSQLAVALLLLAIALP